jgi:hypothetical protein
MSEKDEEQTLLLRYKQIKQTIQCKKSNKITPTNEIEKFKKDCVKIKWGKVYIDF